MGVEYYTISLCRSPFLKEFATKLEASIKVSGRGWGSWASEAAISADEEGLIEKLTIWIWTHYGTVTTLTILANGKLSVHVALLNSDDETDYEEGFTSQQKHTVEEIIDALVQTVAVSTKLCYSESTVPLLRKFWRYEGTADIEGVL